MQSLSGKVIDCLLAVCVCLRTQLKIPGNNQTELSDKS